MEPGGPAAGAMEPGVPAAGGPAAGAMEPGVPAAGGPALAGGAKDGDRGDDGDIGENLGMRVAGAPGPGGACVGADRDGTGPKSSASKRRSRPSGGATSGAATVSGSQINAVRPAA
jgi:eukaryotic-like serine/threonine-protein kinase